MQYRKCFVLFAVVIAISAVSTAVLAQGVPTAITYQGKLTDTDRVPVPDGQRSMQFSLYSLETGGTALWESGPMNVVTTGGVFSVALGAPPSPPITQGTLRRDELWLEVQVGSEDPLPRARIYSVPYALRAEVALGVPEHSITSLELAPGAVNSGHIGSAQVGSLHLSPPLSISRSGTTATFTATNTGTGVESGPAGLFRATATKNSANALTVTHAGSGTALHVESTGTGLAAEFIGDIITSGVVRSLSTPIAWGSVDSDGSRRGGSTNWTAEWNSSASWYNITFTGFQYSAAYPTVVTPEATTFAYVGYTAYYASTGNLRVMFGTKGSTPTGATRRFSFVVYPP